ncbi:2,3-bisphosphoglycerate-dependent phosphoglycerate mutase [Solibacillus kalamii]|uniref:histidine phosphatase family protein n=1 Tax=Solibacillus kalamii TaxID=1748298 RepID=UPI001EF9A2E5|nr:histidine phosphatase family protein [Solibacillus kalamii]MBM7663757.1 2,3-bisphosphoglycerate-dependent phosphoglycerate mutase [Solibacillus kalamii]
MGQVNTTTGADKLTNLYFVRHAHSIYTPNELNRPLSERGFDGATIVTKLLKTEEIGIVVSSPYKRAVQTVKGIAEYINTEVEILDGFKERTLTTVPANDFNLAITKVWEDYSFSWEGGESNIVAQKRGVETTLNILEKYKGENVVIGTHGNIMVLIMNFFDSQYDFSFWQNLDMPDIYKLTFNGKVLRNVEKIWERI